MTEPPAVDVPAGVERWQHPSSITIVRLHYSADPSKDAAWAEQAQKEAPSELWWRQEMEIDFGAAKGALGFPEFKRQCTVARPFPAPHDWIRWMAIDPHPRVPHYMRWMAVSPWDDHVYYREYWPSKSSGIRGDIAEDDDIFGIDAYSKTIKFFESEEVDVFGPNGYADNQGHKERIYKRVMDPAGKAFAAVVTDGKKEPLTFWQTY